MNSTYISSFIKVCPPTYISSFIKVCPPWMILWLIAVIVRGWSFSRGLSRCHEPILHHHKHRTTANKALILHFFSYFSYDMSCCFLTAALYWHLWSGRLRAADSHHITGVIPSNFKYDNWFQLKLTTLQGSLQPGRELRNARWLLINAKPKY